MPRINPGSPPVKGEGQRLNVILPEEQMKRLQTLLPHGVLSSVIRGLLYSFERSVQEQGFEVVRATIQGDVRILISKFETSVQTRRE